MRTAIVGCGQIADAHIQEIRAIKGAELVGVCDTNKHMANQAARRFGIQGCFTDLEDMIKQQKPDVVHVTTPPMSHWPIARILLDHGIHVYLEKPLTTNGTEAEQLIALAEKQGKLVCVGHNNAFDPSYLRLQEMVRNDDLGDIVHIDSVMGYSLDGPFGTLIMQDPNHWLHSLPGGLAQNNISHPLSMILGFIPEDDLQVEAYGFRHRKKRFGDRRDIFYDELRVLFHSGQSTASLVFSCRSRPLQLYVNVHGTKCMAFASADSRAVKRTKGAAMPGPFAKLQWTADDLKEANRAFWLNAWRIVTARLHYFRGMNTLFRKFYAAIDGKEDMPIPMAEALRTTLIMDRIIERCRLNDDENHERTDK